MKNITSVSGKVITVLLLVVVSATAFISGCRLIDRGDEDAVLAVPTSISGRVVKAAPGAASQRGVERSSILASSNAEGVSGAEVWIEGYPDEFKTTTATDGAYLFTDVPAGDHRIIVKFIDASTGKIMKIRSAILQITQAQLSAKSDDLIGKPAVNVVTGQLRDAKGDFLPQGTILSLWGESFTVGQNGAFTSPPLPVEFSEAEIVVHLPGSATQSTFNAPFVSDVVPAAIDIKVGADDKGNYAPTVVVFASVNGQMVSKVDFGANNVRLVARGSAQSNQGTLSYTWEATAGSLVDGTSESEKIWTAPDYFTVATITVVVKDSNNATGSAQLPILVGIDNPSQVDTTRPTVELSSNKTSVVDSAPFVTTITFNKPVKDFAQSHITVTNAALSEFAATTTDEVFTVKVTPQTEGDVTVSVAENAVTDRSNNRNTASNLLTVANSITPAKNSEKDMLNFAITDPLVAATIDQDAKTITVVVPHATDRSALIASFTLSDKATAKVEDSLQESGTTPNNFTLPVTYKVTAEDETTQEYTVTVTFPKLTTISEFDLSALVTAPVKGETPVTTAIDATQYTSGAINWFEADGTTAVAGDFAAANAYVAKLTLSAKTGYTLNGVTESSFTYTGATSVANAANSGAVTITFTATDPETVTAMAAISGTPQSGQTLTAGALTPAGATVDYKWQVSDNDGSDWADINGEVTNTYVVDLAKSAVGKYVRVVAAGKNSFSGTVNSAAVKVVEGSAAVADVTVDGMINQAMAAKDVVITLINDTIASEIAVNSDLSAWVTNLPTGLTAKAKSAVSAGATTVTIEVAGTPTVLKSEALAIIIPADSLAVRTTNLAVTANANAKFAVTIGAVVLKSVPAGAFQRDGTSTNISTVSAFRMSQHEITRTQFLAIMGTDPSDTSCSSGVSDPVQQVNWYHAIAFCNKLSISEGLAPAYSVKISGSEIDWVNLVFASIPTSADSDWDAATCDWDANGYRLPTEMEWMWAAMGADTSAPGVINTTGYLKAFAGSTGSNALDDYAWYSANSGSMTHPAGTKLPNELGLYDMTGNVWEWCWDCYSSYPAGTHNDYTGSTGSYRILRGGGWDNFAYHVTVVLRGRNNPYTLAWGTGFRVVCP